MKPLPFTPGPSCPRGFTLVEVLIALTLLSIGMLGNARMQLFSTQATHAAYLRGQAVLMVESFIDRMQANSTGVLAGNYNSADVANYTAPQNNNCTETALLPAVSCTPAQLAGQDSWEWQQTLTNLLPGGGGTSCIDSDPDDALLCDGVGTIYSIRVNWTRMETGVVVAKQYLARYES